MDSLTKALDENNYTTVKPLGDKVLVSLNSSEEKTSGGILLPISAQSKPQRGEIVAIGEGRTIGENKVVVGIKAGSRVIYSKYAGIGLEFDGSKHLILKEDEVFGILETEDVKDLKPLNDLVLIKVWWNVLIDVVAAVSTAEVTLRRQWLLDALEISSIAEHPSTISFVELFLTL